MKTISLKTDIAIIGGGAAGCWAALSLSRLGRVRTLVIEKADLERSGCLAAGVNALNAYVGPGRTPEDYADYALKDAHGIARRDLLLSLSRGLNAAAGELEKLGLAVQKEAGGAYALRGWRNLKVNGENLKPLLAGAVRRAENVALLNRVNAVSLLTEDGAVRGLVALGTREAVAYLIEARAIICAAGGAAGLYRPAAAGLARHKTWYCPFNSGASYALGLAAGAEMTTLEMRFVALRCRDTLAPTGTLALGGARQINGLGEAYEARYGLTTSQRVYAVRRETREGRGPCRLATGPLSREERENFYRAYAHMSPGQTLKWLEEEWAAGPAAPEPRPLTAEITGSEPYVLGGHTASGYWVDTRRRTTLAGLFAAGDAAGGCPQKYLSGALAEARLAAEAALDGLVSRKPPGGQLKKTAIDRAEAFLGRRPALFTARSLEDAMQKTMDLKAGGPAAGYRFNLRELEAAEARLGELSALAGRLAAADARGLLEIYELHDRLMVARQLVAHLKARRETRWPGFGEFSDFPETDERFRLFVNSRLKNGEPEIILRPMAEGENYEHSD